jgi:DNA-binding XRE family transcriptional regulator
MRGYETLGVLDGKRANPLLEVVFEITLVFKTPLEKVFQYAKS